MEEDARLIRIEEKLDQLQEDVTILKTEMGFAKRGAMALLALVGAVIT